MRFLTVSICAVIAVSVNAEERSSQGRQIEEVIVTAEKRQSTVSDTSISITAFTAEMLDDMGIQNADEFVNFIPATTRDDYDIRIRGVGRNFRALGGDPGVATYYNGVYSEDALIALTENGLWDLERIEVLRGPQGTLYGRNSIGGAINYISKKPSQQWEGTLRTQLGKYDTHEFYGAISGPIIEDKLAFRLTGSKQKRNGSQKGQFGTHDINDANDQNFALSLEWQASDTLKIETRINDRRSLRTIGVSTLIDQGWGSNRGSRGTDLYAFGLRSVSATTPGADRFDNSFTGEVAYGAPIRPGVDVAASLFPNEAYRGIDYLNGRGDPDDADPEALTNNENNEEFDQRSISLTTTWDIAENTTLRYIFGYSDFVYTFNIDGDHANGILSDPNSRNRAVVDNRSHELQLLWGIGENLQMTSGLYYFDSERLQDSGSTNSRSQNRIQSAADYGLFTEPNPFLGGASIFEFFAQFGAPALVTPPIGLDEAPVGQTVAALWGGDAADFSYRQKNTNSIEQIAAFTQGTYSFNDAWALTLGVRWAQDEKEVYENRGGIFESTFPVTNFGGFFDIPGLLTAFGVPYFEASSLSDLALINVAMGRATTIPGVFGEDAITPLCALDDANCMTPLLLQGVPFSFAGRAQDKQDWEKFTWRANLDWTPTDDLLVYFSATTGYRAGGYGLGILDARVGPPTALKPLSYDEEEVLAYELGYKGEFLDGTMQVNASIYRYDYEGYQDNVVIYDPLENSFRDIPTNTGDAVNQGFEIEATWLATDNLTLNGNYSYTDTEYQDDVYFLENDDPTRPTALFPIDPDPSNPGGTPGLYLTKGSSLKGIPEHKAVLWGSYRWETRVGRIMLNASTSYTGESYPSSLERDLDKLDSRLRTDVSLIWESNDQKRRVRFFVDNVTDERNYRSFSTGGASNNYKFAGSLLAERYWGMDARWDFGGA